MSSDKKKSKRRKDEYTGPGGNEETANKSPPKDEFKVAKWMKKNIPTKKTKFLNHNVEYFTASKALDALLTTAFAQGDAALFTTRDEAIAYLDSMLVHKFFHRAKKVPVSEAELRRGKKQPKEVAAAAETSAEQQPPTAEEATTEGSELRRRTAAANKDAKGDTGSELDVQKSPKTPATPADAAAATEKKKRKIRLDMHPDQQFVDGAEAYIWIYDPIPVHYWLFGALLVFGAIVVCLFPLWPPTLRLGVYYLSVAAAGFLVFILSLAVIRFIVFCAIWLLTGSRHHFWLFPNLTEDVGFFASFWPLYQHDYVGGEKETAAAGKKSGSKSAARKSAVKKEKLSDAEEEQQQQSEKPLLAAATTAKAGAVLKEEAVKEQRLASGVEEAETESEEQGPRSHSDSESECSQKSSIGKDFEMVNPEEVEMS